MRHWWRAVCWRRAVWQFAGVLGFVLAGDLMGVPLWLVLGVAAVLYAPVAWRWNMWGEP